LNARFLRCANALAHANTLALIVKGQTSIFLDDVTSAWSWDKVAL
jgi:hypothetical protein